MSFGLKSPVYKPVSASMLEMIHDHFPNISPTNLERMFEILTEDLHTETLLFVATASKVSRFLSGERDEAGFGFGPGIRLSALRKDGTGKMQTAIMELLHDVIVELPMAGRNFAMLQKFLAQTFDCNIVLYHSCGDAAIPCGNLDAFYDASADEQKKRTWLDWSGTTEKNVSVEQILREGIYSRHEAEVAALCFSVAEKAVAGRRELQVA